MGFEPFGDLLAMSHHGPYIRSAYDTSLLVLAINIAEPLLIRRRYLQEEARHPRREAQQ